MIRIARRPFLMMGAALATGALPRSEVAAEAIPTLRATTRTLDIHGRPASVLGLLRNDGGHGLVIEPGARFRARLHNQLGEPTIIHWHGQIPPVAQDGVPDAPLPMLQPGDSRGFDFAATPGTHWMHAHVPDQEMRLLAAPLIVRTAEDARADRQEVVMMLHDYSFTPLPEILARLHTAPGHASGAMPPPNPHAGGGPHGGAAAMDLNDIDFDAYLANDRTLDDPQLVRIERGGRVLLRIINGAGATVFRLDTGALEASLVAVDGQPVTPVVVRNFALSMGQRADLLVQVPAEGGAFPVLALREGARERTGIVLATAGAPVRRLDLLGERAAAAWDPAQEGRLRAATPLPARRVNRRIEVALTGSMQPYLWSLDDRPWGRHRILAARPGERVEFAMTNRTMMGHPMHLHGHHFQVVEADGRRFAGAVRDTVQVPPMGRVTVAFEAGEAAGWMFHCHHMPHLATGMMTVLSVAA
jgi:FtsP/CotA-like multicopper oxidase with cupredoxin domain